MKTTWIRQKCRDDRGVVMLEALIVYTVTIFLLFFILAVFSVLFQRWNIQTVANEAAGRMAQTYRLMEADESTGFIEADDLVEVREYRYLWDRDELKTAVDRKIKHYAGWRLTNTTFTKNAQEPKITVAVKKDALARRHVEVTIVGSYRVPFGEALSFFGFTHPIEYEVSAYADCVDIIDYVNTIDFVDAQTSLKKLDSRIVSMVDALLKLFDNIVN